MELPPEFGELPRLACPECGSTARAFSEAMGSGNYLCAGGSISLVHTRPGLQSTADADDQGKITLTAKGPAPRNEEGALEMCLRLVRALNKAGASWVDPVEGDQDVDAQATDDAGQVLKMQVVRASNNGRLWQQVSEAGSATVSYDATEVAREMIEAIRKKSGKYPAEQKGELTLVLDSARTPSHTFQTVFDTFREKHRDECRRAGFAAVWAIGPHDSLVNRLD